MPPPEPTVAPSASSRMLRITIDKFDPAAEPEVAPNATGIDAAGAVLQPIDRDRAELRRAGHRSAKSARAHCVDGQSAPPRAGHAQ
jgi:hypothetical protein